MTPAAPLFPLPSRRKRRRKKRVRTPFVVKNAATQKQNEAVRLQP